ncbi:MAG: hypothetical protein NC489_22090 [Ruminococcus flavefaciens]|nr:hypothetical protein [Ruminococcus flavefaciens]
MCLALCVVFALALVGCGNTYTDEDDYANFVRWQTRYETEKELVGLLRKYDAAYSAYKGGASDGSNIVFSIRGVTVLTDANVAAATVVYDGTSYCYCVSIELDNSGAKILAEVTASNVGETLDIVAVSGDSRTVLLSPIITGTVGDGKVRIAQETETAANNLCSQFSAGAVKNAAIAYNAKRIALSARTVSVDYLPLSLPEAPEFLDVSGYLQKADALGF